MHPSKTTAVPTATIDPIEGEEECDDSDAGCTFRIDDGTDQDAGTRSFDV